MSVMTVGPHLTLYLLWWSAWTHDSLWTLHYVQQWGSHFWVKTLIYSTFPLVTVHTVTCTDMKLPMLNCFSLEIFISLMLKKCSLSKKENYGWGLNMVEYGLYTFKKNMTMGIWKYYLEFLIVSDLWGTKQLQY